MVKNEERSGRPLDRKTDENVQKVVKLVCLNRKITIRELIEEVVQCTVNNSYKSVQSIVGRLWNAVRKTRLGKWGNSFLLHHDNAPCHMTLLIREFLAVKSLHACSHPLYSPDLAPCDLWIFLKIKNCTKRKTFWHYSCHWDSHDKAAESPSKTSLPEMFPVVNLTLT